MSIIPSRFAILDNWNFNNVLGLQVYAIDPPGQSTRTLNRNPIARRNYSKTASAFAQENLFNVSLYIVRPTHELLEAAMDTLYANIQDIEGTLIVPMSGTVRQYTVTYKTTKINNAITNTNTPPGGVADLTLQFECSDTFGYDTAYTLITNQSGLTAANVATPYTQGGGAKYQVPFIQAQYTAAPGGASSGQVSIGNNATGQIIQTAARPWLQYDLLQVDLQHKSVLVNGSQIDFTGAMFEFGQGLQEITYSDNFSSRTFKWFCYVYNRWN